MHLGAAELPTPHAFTSAPSSAGPLRAGFLNFAVQFNACFLVFCALSLSLGFGGEAPDLRLAWSRVVPDPCWVGVVFSWLE